MLIHSKLLLSSSDLSHIKVSRHQGDQELQWVLDCSKPETAPDFWLRDGDVIDVPEKQ